MTLVSISTIQELAIPLPTVELLFLFVAGFSGGVINSIAGGGSFITFPALLFVGVPPITANATNTYASCAGYMSGAFAFRRDLLAHRSVLPRILFISFCGGILGAWLLLQTSETLFTEAIPWLLLLATTLFVFGAQINSIFKRWAGTHRHASIAGAAMMAFLLLGICTYGGFFNAGLGIIALSYLTLAGYTDINAMNGLKLLISSTVSIVAIALFIHDGVIAWYAGTVLLLGTLAGGYFSARLSRRLPQHMVRRFVIFASCIITVFFFYDTYWLG
jgi:uncharacterized membrane protein YfcA